MVNVTIRGGGRFEAILAVDFLIDDYTESYQRNDYRGDNPPWTHYLTADAFRVQLQFVLTLSDTLDLSAAESSEPTVSPDSTPDPNASSPAESSDASSPSTSSPAAGANSFGVTISRFVYEPPT